MAWKLRRGLNKSINTQSTPDQDTATRALVSIIVPRPTPGLPLSRLSPQGQGLQASPRPADTDSNSSSHILRAHGLRQQTKVAQTLLSACWYCSKQQQNQKGAEENVLGCLGEQSYVSISPCLLQHMKSWGTEIKSMNYFPKRQEW